MKHSIKELVNHFAKRSKGLIANVISAKLTTHERILQDDMKKIWSFYAIIFVVGRIILMREPFRYGLIHQICLITISLLVFYMLKYCYVMGNRLQEASSGLMNLPNNEGIEHITMYDHLATMKKCQQSIWCFIVPIYPALRFAWKTLYLEYVPNSMVGYYAVFLGTSTFYIALIAYTQLVISIVFFGKIAFNIGKCLFLQFPHDLINVPQWLNYWVEYFTRAEKAFFVTGTLFTFEYVLLMPPQIITVSPHFVIHSKNPAEFIVSWLIIVVLIIVGFPIIAFTVKYLFKTLLRNMHKLVNEEFDKIWVTKCNANSLSELWAYEQLSSNTMKLGSYIFRKKSYFPVITTGISLLLNILKLYESLLFPLLSGMQN